MKRCLVVGSAEGDKPAQTYGPTLAVSVSICVSLHAGQFSACLSRSRRAHCGHAPAKKASRQEYAWHGKEV